jgi:hypothetical protein
MDVKGIHPKGRQRSRCHTGVKKYMERNWGRGIVGRQMERLGCHMTHLKYKCLMMMIQLQAYLSQQRTLPNKILP